MPEENIFFRQIKVKRIVFQINLRHIFHFLSNNQLANYLTSKEAIEAYLESAFETEDTGHIINAINTVIRAQGMTKIAKKSGLDRSNLYDTFGKVNGDPRISTVSKIMNTFGYRLSFEPNSNRREYA